MMTIRKSEERGRSQFDWLDSRHTFSFGEYKDPQTKPAHLLQIWIMSDRKGVAPRYEQKKFDTDGLLRLVVSGDGRDGSLAIHQDADMYVGRLAAGKTMRHVLKPGRHAWV